jgi:hypothetical protein
MHWINRDALAAFLIALLLRAVAVAVTTATSLNTYSQSDANAFSQHANRIAGSILSGTLPVLNFSSIDDVWGAMLSPFWLLPGPSRIYARLGIALLGAVATYNVYIIVRNYHSNYAGLIAVLPMIFYPSFLFIHATVLREGMVLFGLTMAARLLLAPGPRLTHVQQYSLSVFFICIAAILRSDNVPIYVLVLIVAVLFKYQPWSQYERITKTTAVIGAAVSPTLIITIGRDVLDQLLYLRQVRGRGRTAYLTSIFPNTLLEAIAFSWIGGIYFLFTPLPWMISQIMDLIIAFEGFINIVYFIAAITGARLLAQKALPGTMALIVGITAGAVLYGLGTVNVGTAVRHRQMILWAVFLLGGIGLSEHVHLRFSKK